jgi:hypothetical protein
MQIPGSYLCRMQDGDLKYMVSFSASAVSGIKEAKEGLQGAPKLSSQ